MTKAQDPFAETLHYSQGHLGSCAMAFMTGYFSPAVGDGVSAGLGDGVGAATDTSKEHGLRGVKLRSSRPQHAYQMSLMARENASARRKKTRRDG